MRWLYVAALAGLITGCRHPAWVGQPPGAEDRFTDCAEVLLRSCPRRTRAHCMMLLAGSYRESNDKAAWLEDHQCER